MKLVLAVLALAAVATAGVVVEHPVEHPVEKSAVQPSVLPAEKSAMPVEAPAVKLDSDPKMISLYGAPDVPESRRAHEMGGMQKVLNGPVMVAFKDAVEDKMNVFLLPYGFKLLNIYDHEEVRPLVQFLNNGHQKSFMSLSAGSHLQVPEMLKKLDQIHLPAYNLNTAVRIAEKSSPYPYVLIVDTDSIRGNSRVADLKELGVFKLENGVLEVVRDNYPNEKNLNVDHAASRSFGIVLPANSEEDAVREYVKSVFADKDLVREYMKPVYTGKGLVSEHPFYTGKGLVSEHPVYTGKGLLSAHPFYTERDLGHEYVKPVYTRKGLVSKHPFYTESDLAHEYFGSDYADAEKDLIRDVFINWKG